MTKQRRITACHASLSQLWVISLQPIMHLHIRNPSSALSLVCLLGLSQCLYGLTLLTPGLPDDSSNHGIRSPFPSSVIFLDWLSITSPIDPQSWLEGRRRPASLTSRPAADIVSFSWDARVSPAKAHLHRKSTILGEWGIFSSITHSPSKQVRSKEMVPMKTHASCLQRKGEISPLLETLKVFNISI